MRTILAAALLIGSAIVLIPNATAAPCDVGDDTNVCVDEESSSSGDCTNGGYEYGSTSASATAGGETVTAYGNDYCTENSWGGYSTQNYGVSYTGSQGSAMAYFSSYEDSSGYRQCHLVMGFDSGGNAFSVPHHFCTAGENVDWGNVL